MEVVDFAGYTEKEKAEIAKKYLLPRQLEESGLTDKDITFTEDAIMSIVSNYTRESGVRQLERQIGAVARKLARKIASSETVDHVVDAEGVRELLGRPRVHPEHALAESEVGIATGMYYTPMGGDISSRGFDQALYGLSKRRYVSGPGRSGVVDSNRQPLRHEGARALVHIRTNTPPIWYPRDRLAPSGTIHVPAAQFKEWTSAERVALLFRYGGPAGNIVA